MNDAKALWRAIAKNPGEDTPKLALADWYGEQERPEMAHALRWCVARKRWPHRFDSCSLVCWIRQARAKGGGPRPEWARRCTLPASLYDALPRRWEPVRGFSYCGTAEAAVRKLAAALERLRSVLEVPSV